jgi:hypothetical protein
MPFPSWSPTEDNASFDGPTLQAILQNIRDSINDLPEGATLRHSLGRYHLLPAAHTPKTTQLTSTVHTYNDTANPYPGWNTVVGWAEITSGVTPLRATFTTPIDLTSAVVYGVEVVANVYCYDLYYNPAAASSFYYAYFAIQIVDNLGTVYHIARSECYIDSEIMALVHGPKRQDVPIEAIIKASDLPAGRTLAQVRVVISLRDGSGGAGEVRADLKNCMLCARVLHAGAL